MTEDATVQAWPSQPKRAADSSKLRRMKWVLVSYGLAASAGAAAAPGGYVGIPAAGCGSSIR